MNVTIYGLFHYIRNDDNSIDFDRLEEFSNDTSQHSHVSSAFA